MPKITFKSTDEFITAANIINGNKYTYKNFIYTTMEGASYITCHTHGDFLQRPEKHLKRKQGCPSCGGCLRKTLEEFIYEAKTIHGELYNYDLVNYINYTTKVKIICKHHGIFEQIPLGHLAQRQGCPICGGTVQGNTNKFIEKARAVHGDLYDYSKVDYTNNKNKVTIICQYHGEFLQSPIQHTAKGTGCAKCNVTGGYSEKWFREHPEGMDIPGILYIIKLTDANQSFYKIGITKKTVDQRFSTTKNMGVGVQPVKVFETTIGLAFQTEQRILRSTLHSLPKPIGIDIHGGESECFLASDDELAFILSKVEFHLYGNTTPLASASLNLSK